MKKCYGFLAGQDQRDDVRSQAAKNIGILTNNLWLIGPVVKLMLTKSRAFISPILLLNTNPFSSEEPHNSRAFGRWYYNAL
jgi:hypothetical protein